MNKYKFDFPNEGWDTMQFCKRVPNEDQLEVALFQHNAKGMEFYRVDEVDARIAELEQELEKANSRENQHRGCDIAGRACGSNCPYWAKYSDNIIDHHDPAKDLWKSV